MQSVLIQTPRRYHFVMAEMISGTDPMQVLAAAVTPVVLVSATAILIGSVNTRYIAIADRIRSLAGEWRDPGCSAPRKLAIRQQLKTFDQRITLVAWAVRALYSAVACFAGMALIISATTWRKVLQSITLPMFVAGIMLVLAAILIELFELHLSKKTISTEVRDVTAD